MTDTILPLAEADVLALGYTPFGFSRDDRMGEALAHKDGEAFYLCRRGAFWSLDPEYSNMRGVLCEEPPNWRHFRGGCGFYGVLYSRPEGSSETDVFVWRVSYLPVERAERLGNYHTIAPVLAGLKAQAEVGDGKDIANHPITKNRWVTKNEDPKPVVKDLALPYAPPAPAPRRPLKVGDKVIAWKRGSLITYTHGGEEVEVAGVRRVMDAYGAVRRQVMIVADWEWEDSVSLILPDSEG